MTLQRSAVVIANEIRLKRSQHRGSFVLVEGSDDKLFYGRFCNSLQCKLVVAEGKRNVCEVLGILDDDRFRGALGIVDTDFDLIDGVPASSPNILRGDCHDVEAMLVRSSALDHVLRELGSEEKIDRFYIKTGTDIRQALLQGAAPLAYLRWHSLRSGLGLRFDGLQLSQVVDRNTLAVDISRLITTVKNHSQRQDLKSTDLESAIAALKSTTHDVWQLCNGHDLVGVLSIALRWTIGSQRAIATGVEELKRALRLAYAEVDFAASEHYRLVREWEQSNYPFQVLG